ncbi:sensor domain-containing diguanylate cyclase [Oceanospirillum beijerinckii]|uniref:sensor domain-containing diguanylate cyclase n=1 Tax=Oceanospirillum beijerinckii TaxID=64976 RepID=UPI00042592A3|nr:diguanylate cyclase [Oceanospirillum beijerinckii]
MSAVSDHLIGAVMAQSKELLLLLDPESLKFIYSNSAAETYLGYAAGEICDLPPHNLLPEFLEPEVANLIENLASQPDSPISMNTVLVSKLSGLRDYVLQMQYVDVEDKKMVLIAGHDVTDRMAEADQMQEMLADAQMNSMLDQGTGLMQKVFFLPYLLATMHKSVETKQPYGLILLDITNIPEINEQFGQAAGDRVLLHVGQIVKRLVEFPEFAARFSGKKVCLLMSEANKGSVQELVKQLMRAMGRLAYPNYPSLSIQPRMGVFFGKQAFDPEQILELIGEDYKLKREEKPDLLVLLNPELPADEAPRADPVEPNRD